MQTVRKAHSLFMYVLVALLCGAAGVTSHVSQTTLSRRLAAESQSLPTLPPFLPKREFVHSLTFGADVVVANVLWFYTINYFGEQFRGQGNYRWLSHMCSLVTDLDPKLLHVTEFCAMSLAWHAKDTKESLLLLTNAMDHHPTEWRLWYLRAFYRWYFLGELEEAARDLTEATKIQGAPPFLAALAARLTIGRDDPQTAVIILAEILEQTKDERLRARLEDDLKGAILARDLKLLTGAIRLYEKRHGVRVSDLHELISAGILNAVPTEPFGGTYLIDNDTYEVVTSTGERPLRFVGKFASNSNISKPPVGKQTMSDDRKTRVAP